MLEVLLCEEALNNSDLERHFRMTILLFRKEILLDCFALCSELW